MIEQRNPVSDLIADGAALDQLVAGLSPEQWRISTPAPGWSIAHQIAHLAATFRLAGLAASNPEGFAALGARLSPDFNANVTAALNEYVGDPPEVLLDRWRAERAGAEKALGALPSHQQVPWLVRPLPAGVLACAGMMETFAHGQDIADALGVDRTHTDRIGQLVAFAVRTWDFGYQARKLPTPDVALRFEITAPSGAVWEFGPSDSPERISGPAVDFCLLVTRRRHPDDLAVRALGPLATEWLGLAQAYRGPAGEGRRPGQFRP